MCEYHCVHEPDLAGDPCSRECRYARQKIGAKENSAKGCRLDPEANVKPIGDNALHHEPARKRIETKQRGEFQYDATRAVQAKARLWDRRICFRRFDGIR